MVGESSAYEIRCLDAATTTAPPPTTTLPNTHNLSIGDKFFEPTTVTNSGWPAA